MAMAAFHTSGLWAGTRALFTEQAQRPAGRGATNAPAPAASASSRSTSPGRPRTTARSPRSRDHCSGRAARNRRRARSPWRTTAPMHWCVSTSKPATLLADTRK
eukprot:2184775-Alexandrium_andersonii.AAC.1